MVLDFHSHLLPGIDDGSESIDTSIMMLRMWRQQGVKHIVATPHFYADKMSPSEFIATRDKSYEALTSRINSISSSTSEGFPIIGLGAEVYFYDGISHSEELESLCFMGTNLLLLEMPFCKWNDRIIDEVEAIYRTTDIIPVIAHLERYMEEPKKYIKRLLSMGIPIQCNAEYLLNPKTSRKALKFFEKGVVQFLGSDAHNMSNRIPNIGPAVSLLESKLGSDFVSSFEKRQLEIIKENMVI